MTGRQGGAGLAGWSDTQTDRPGLARDRRLIRCRLPTGKERRCRHSDGDWARGSVP